MSLSVGRLAAPRPARAVLTALLAVVATAATLAVGAAPAFADPPAVDVKPVLSLPADFAVDENPAGSGHAVVDLDVSATGAVDPDDMDLGCADGSVGLPLVGAVLAVGVHHVTCTATDDADSTTGTFTVTVNPAVVATAPGQPSTDTPPSAVAGGPYTVAEGQPLHLDASGSADPDGDPLTYSWDLNGDGVFDDATGVSPTLSWAQLESRSINDGPATFAVRVQVDDGRGGVTVSAPTTLTVVNTPPVAFVGGAPSPTAGLTVTWVLSSTDPSVVDQAAGFSYDVSYGDGVTDAAFHAGGAAVRQHTYATPGLYTVSLTTTDKDGGVSAVATKTVVVVALLPDVCGSTAKTLVVDGTAGDDVITIGPGTATSATAVTINGFTESVPTADFGNVVVDAEAGNDTVTFTGPLAVPRIVYGGTGNDTLVAGAGPAVLIGGDGNDILTGGPARDILVGGTGADRLSGNGDDDVLVPGATSFDADTAAGQLSLCALQAEWTRTDVGVFGRALHLLGVGQGLNGSNRFVLTGRDRNVGRKDCGDVVDGGQGSNFELVGEGR